MTPRTMHELADASEDRDDVIPFHDFPVTPGGPEVCALLAPSWAVVVAVVADAVSISDDPLRLARELQDLQGRATSTGIVVY